MRTLHNRLSAASPYVALLALFVALGGTATAAIMITGKNVKNSSLTSADVKDGSLLLKDFKAKERAKLKGAPGQNGSPGTAGAPGATGDRGASAFDPPPSGSLIRGGGVLDFVAGGTTVTYRSYSPLPITLATPLDSVGAGRNLYFGGNNASQLVGEADTTQCSGTAAAPDPKPGILCVYVVYEENAKSNSATLVDGALGGVDQADASGFSVTVQHNAAAQTFYRWDGAYLAP